MKNKGSLFLVSTPIGNLNDLSQRAKDVLSQCPVVLAEDTRKTGQMLKNAKINISGKLVSYYEQNELERIPQVIGWLENGQNVALVSNGGTPLVSDPGYKLVKEAIAQKIKIIPVSGPSALLTALVASGFATDKFVFLGFLPRKTGRKKKILEEVARLTYVKTIIIYESPNRLIKTLVTINQVFGNISLAIGREMTKIHEEFLYGKTEDLLLKLKQIKRIKGEVTLVLSTLER